MQLCSLEQALSGAWHPQRLAPPYGSEADFDAWPHKYQSPWAQRQRRVDAATFAPWEYRWRPDANCSFPSFRPRLFCSRARSMLFVGDSLVFQIFKSLVALINATGVSCLRRRSPPPAVGRQGIGACHVRACAGRVRLAFIQNKMSAFTPRSNITGRSSDRVAAQPGWGWSTWGNRTLYDIGAYSSWAHPEVLRPFPLLLWSAGIFALDASGGHDGARYVAHLRAVAAWLERHFEGRHLFHAPLPAASGCGCSSMPNDLIASALDRCSSPARSKFCRQFASLQTLKHLSTVALGGSSALANMWHVLKQRSDSYRGSGCSVRQRERACDPGAQRTPGVLWRSLWGMESPLNASFVRTSCGVRSDCVHWFMPGALDIFPRVFQLLFVRGEWQRVTTHSPDKGGGIGALGQS